MQRAADLIDENHGIISAKIIGDIFGDLDGKKLYIVFSQDNTLIFLSNNIHVYIKCTINGV